MDGKVSENDINTNRHPIPSSLLPSLSLWMVLFMKTIRTSNGEWAVVSNDMVVAGPFDTNAEAWRWIDRQEGSPISRGEAVSDWIWAKQAGGE